MYHLKIYTLDGYIREFDTVDPNPKIEVGWGSLASWEDTCGRRCYLNPNHIVGVTVVNSLIDKAKEKKSWWR